MGLFSSSSADKAIDALFTKSSKKNSREPEIDLEDAYFLKKRERQAVEDAKTDSVQDPEATKSTEKTDEKTGENTEEKEDDETEEKETEETEEVDVEIEAGPVKENDGTADEDEMETLFVKNVPNVVITDKKALSEFKKLFGPGIKSVRFRSIAMSEAMPRRAAFITKKVHEERNSINAYIVYKDKDQYFAKLNSMNVHEFRGHHLFVSSASKPKQVPTKLSVFIGNLPFDTTEEQLYQFFKECGPITNVRCVRDRKFNIGKGFAYVQFDEPSHVQIALQKNGQKFEGRDLRVSQCSSLQTQKKKNINADKSFKQKSTPRSIKGKKLRKPKAGGVSKTSSDGPQKVFEGQRAKESKVSLGKKRRSQTGRNGANSKRRSPK